MRSLLVRELISIKVLGRFDVLNFIAFNVLCSSRVPFTLFFCGAGFKFLYYKFYKPKIERCGLSSTLTFFLNVESANKKDKIFCRIKLFSPGFIFFI